MWPTMVFDHGRPWSAMADHGRSWSIMVGDWMQGTIPPHPHLATRLKHNGCLMLTDDTLLKPMLKFVRADFADVQINRTFEIPCLANRT